MTDRRGLPDDCPCYAIRHPDGSPWVVPCAACRHHGAHLRPLLPAIVTPINSRLKENPMYPTLFATAGVKDFAEAIDAERQRQLAKFGDQNHPDGTGNKGQQEDADRARQWCEAAFGSGYGTWADILDEEVAEAKAERDPAKLRAELLQVAAVCAAWIWAIDNRPTA